MSCQEGALAAVAPPRGVIRPSREVATRLVVQLLPEYMEVFREAQRPEGWRKVAEVFGQIRKRLKIDGYVALYDDERRLHCSVSAAKPSRSTNSTTRFSGAVIA